MAIPKIGETISPEQFRALQPEKEQEENFFKSLARGILRPAATLLARPVQLGLALTGAETPEEQAIDIPFIGRIGAPTKRKDIIRDIGRGAETVALAFGGAGIQAARRAIPIGLRALARRGAIEGAKGGALFGAGEAVEREGELRAAPRGAAVGAALGAVGGAVLPTTIVGLVKAPNALFKTTRNVVNTINPSNRKVAINHLATAYESSFIEGKSAVFAKINTLSKQQNKTTQETLKELATEGYVPTIDGDIARWGAILDDLSDRQLVMVQSLDNVLQQVPDVRIPLSALISRTEKTLRKSPQVIGDLNKSLQELKSVGNSLRNKFGDNINILDVNRIRVDMNRRTKAFKGELFLQDTADAIGDTTREILDELVPSRVIRDVNAEIGRLKNMSKVVKLFDNKKINTGIFANQLGRYLGTIGLAQAGITAAVGGPGALVVAGIAAYAGSRALSGIIRSLRFNPKLKRIIIGEIIKDKEILNRLLQEASELDAKFLIKEVEKASRKLLGPGAISLGPRRQAESFVRGVPAELPPIPLGRQLGPGAIQAGPRTFEAGIKVSPAKKGVGRDPKTGKFKRIFTGEIK